MAAWLLQLSGKNDWIIRVFELLIALECIVGSIVWVTNGIVVADKCEVIHNFSQLPRKIAVKSILTGRRYSVFPEWHCYNSEQIAIQAAEKYKEGYVDMIY